MIVVSILLAFGIDALWEERGIRSEEQDVLIRLEAELDEAASHLSEWRVHQEGVASAGRALLSHTGGSSPLSISADSVASLVWALNFDWDADPPTGVLSSVISTGQLAVIRNQDLRAALVRWESSFRDLQRAERMTAEMNGRRLIPMLESRLAWRNVAAIVEGADLGTSSFPFGMSEILAEREFESVVANRVLWVDVVVAKYDAILEDLDRTRSLVRSVSSERH